MSKGSTRRPAIVADKIIEENWQRIFGNQEAQKIISGDEDEH